MKAMVLKAYNEDLVLEDVPDPVAGEGEIVLQVRSCGMCFTDVKIVTGQLKNFVTLPHIPGHEIAGEVVAVGHGVHGISVGDKGVAYFIISCGQCELCLTGQENLCVNITRLGFEQNGGYAQYVRMPAANLCTFQSDTPFPSMAVIPDAVATPYHALVNMVRLHPGQKLLVVGAGGLGLNAIQIALLMGLEVTVADINDAALKLALQMGAKAVINPQTVKNPLEAARELTFGLGFDAVLEGVGREETVSWSLNAMKKGAICIIMGYDPIKPVPIPMIAMHNNQWHLVGTKVSTRQGQTS